MHTSRRGFLRGAGALALAASSGVARADGGLIDRNVPGAAGPFKVLEVFFAGGLSHRETLWVERPDEAPVLRRLGTLDPRSHPITRPPDSPADWTGWLPARGAYEISSSKVGTAGGRDIHLGPCGEPLVRTLAGGGRLVDRLRVIATGHELDVHEPAQALLLQGNPASRARASGVGAAITRHSGLPSWVFYNSGLHDPSNAALEALVSGTHGAESAPILVPYDAPDLVGRLGGARDAPRDQLARLYADRYEDGLTFAHPTAAGLRARSAALDRYLTSIGGAFRGPTLAAALGELSASSGTSLWDNGTRRALRCSAQILDAGLSRYCCVVDGGVAGSPGEVNSHHDMHGVASSDDHAAYATANALNVLRTLREEIDSGRLDLSDTLVVLNTEFGRSFSSSVGSDHCYRGFAVAMLGGPIPAGRGGVVGDLPFGLEDDGATLEGTNPAVATGGLDPRLPVSPTDLRAAVLQAAGIHPFQAEIFDPSDTNTPGLGRDDAADALARHIFGA